MSFVQVKKNDSDLKQTLKVSQATTQTNTTHPQNRQRRMMERLEKTASSTDDNKSATTAATTTTTNTSTTSRGSTTNYSRGGGGSSGSVGSGSTTSSTGSRNTKAHSKSPDGNKIKSYLSKAREQREKEKQRQQEQKLLAKGGAEEALLLPQEDALSPPSSSSSSSPVDELVTISPTGKKIMKKAIQRDPHLEPLASKKTSTTSRSPSSSSSSSGGAAGTPLFGGTTAASAKLSSSFWKEHHGDRLADPTDTPTREARKKAIVVRMDDYELAGTVDLESMGSSSSTTASTSTYSSLRGGSGSGGRGGKKGRRAPARSTSTTWKSKPGILKEDEKKGLFGSLRDNVWCCRFLGLLLAAGFITLVVLLSVSLAQRNSSEAGFTTGNDEEESTFLEVGEGATVESDSGLGGGPSKGFIIVVVVMFVVTLSIFGLQWTVKRQKQKRAEAQKSAIFAYLQNFDVEDVDLRKSPPGGWHGTYLNKLSYGINKAEWGNLQHGDNSLAEKVETAPLTHSSIVKDSLFLV